MALNLTLAGTPAYASVQSPDTSDYINEIVQSTEGLINGGQPTASALAPPKPATAGASTSALSSPVVWVVGIALVVAAVVLVSKQGG